MRAARAAWALVLTNATNASSTAVAAAATTTREASHLLLHRWGTSSERGVWTGTGGPDRGDGSRIGRHDERPPPPPVCELCHRRFCQCVDKPPSQPPYPGPEDCCQSAPQSKFCVWEVYEQQLSEYEAYVQSKSGGQ